MIADNFSSLSQNRVEAVVMEAATVGAEATTITVEVVVDMEEAVDTTTAVVIREAEAAMAEVRTRSIPLVSALISLLTGAFSSPFLSTLKRLWWRRW